MRQALIVFLKELIDGLRDRRSVLSLLLFPLAGPLAISAILARAADKIGSDVHVELPVVGREAAPQLMEFLERNGIDILEAPGDPLGAVRDGDANAVLVIPPDYAARFTAGRPVRLELIVDHSRNEGTAGTERLRFLLEHYAGNVGAMRLVARGVSPELASPIIVQDVDVSTPRGRAALFLNFIPMFVLIASFIGGMYTATDATAGERERGSLEPLLITPALRSRIVIGKWLAAVVFSMVTVVFTLVCTIASLGFVPAEQLGISLSLGTADAIGVLVAVLPLSLFVPASQLLVASFARTFKEAQTYLSLMIFVPMLPAVFSTISPAEGAPWMMAVPVLGQQMLLLDLIEGNPIAPASWWICGAVAALAGLICVQITAMLFQRERIIFGR